MFLILQNLRSFLKSISSNELISFNIFSVWVSSDYFVVDIVKFVVNVFVFVRNFVVVFAVVVLCNSFDIFQKFFLVFDVH